MVRKAETPPSRFWGRLIEAWGERGLATTQNGVAKALGRRHSSVWRWYHGECLPELDTCRRLAIKGGVTVDWLITGRKPKYPISGDPLLSKIMEICADLDHGARREVLKSAKKWLAKSS